MWHFIKTIDTLEEKQSQNSILLESIQIQIFRKIYLLLQLVKKLFYIINLELLFLIML